MRRAGAFAGVSLGAVAVTAMLFTLVFRSPADWRAIWLAAAVAWTVQMVGFAIVRLSPPRRLLTAWSAAAALRFLTLIGFAFVVVKPHGLPATASLISLASFLFLSTLIETRFLK
jgi:hypothetical protein